MMEKRNTVEPGLTPCEDNCSCGCQSVAIVADRAVCGSDKCTRRTNDTHVSKQASEFIDAILTDAQDKK